MRQSAIGEGDKAHEQQSIHRRKEKLKNQKKKQSEERNTSCEGDGQIEETGRKRRD